jgi:hypothetical protein
MKRIVTSTQVNPAKNPSFDATQQLAQQLRGIACKSKTPFDNQMGKTCTPTERN